MAHSWIFDLTYISTGYAVIAKIIISITLRYVALP